MRIYDIIYKKRDRVRLSPEEVRFVVSSYTDGSIPDYQMAAFLMAVFLCGLDDGELGELTAAMTASGEVVDLSSVPGPKVDKHSTGGVGDGTSLVLAPLAAAAGCVVPMMSGRALGHTGGTLDKLESIPGFRVHLSDDEYVDQLRTLGAAMIGQSERVAPADRKIYALRDVTATVDCIPLIAASIMSKKMAEGTDSLVLDVKTGSGAFMRSLDDARRLADTMASIGRSRGMRMASLITNMDRPLGRAVGNALEVRQAIETLRGEGPDDFTELTMALGARMLTLSGIDADAAAARRRLEGHLRDGSALERFRRIVEAQGGDPRVVDEPDRVLPSAPASEVLSDREGVVAAVDTRAVGIAAILAGAGRNAKEDRIDYGAGFVIHRKPGDRVGEGEPLATLYCGSPDRAAEAAAALRRAYTLGENPPEPSPLVFEER